MMRKLTLLTAYFPYPPGEEFIATEMEYLARAYDVIDVVPTARFASPPAAPPPRTLPRNVRVRHDILRRLHATKGRAGVRRGMALLADADGRALLRAALLPAATFWRDPSHGVAARWLSRRARSLLAFIGHALAVRDALQAGGAEPPYYSFWCDATALGATLAAPDAVTVARAHGGDLYVERDPPYFLPLRNETLTRLTRTFCISEHGLRYAQARYPAAAPRLALHRLGVPPAPQRTAVSTDGVLRIVSCAFMLPLKRLDLLAEAVRLVRAPLQWTHLGDGPARVAVENRLASLPPHVDVRLMGHLPGPEVRRFYEAQPVDVFISVSRSEGLPVSMMEAMSFGIPVLGTDVGGVRELVGEATLLPPDPTPAEVAARLDALAALPREQMAEMRQQAWARWQGTVDARVQYPAFIEALNTLAR